MATESGTRQDGQVPPELAELDLVDKEDGPAAAAVISAGVGIFVLGLLTTLAVISESLKEFLTDFQGSVGVGALAGKTTLAVVAWLISWGILAFTLRDKDVDFRASFYIGLALGILGAIGTFPPFFEAFE